MAYKIKRAYFRGNRKYGRTTQLVDVSTEEVVFEAIGICTKADLIKSWKLQIETNPLL